MTTIWRYTLLRLRGEIIGWGLALAAFALIVTLLYDTALQMRDQLEQLLNTLPREIMALVGSLDTVFSPAGFLDARYFTFMPLILGIFATIVGSGLIVSDEENGTLDLILAHPVRRSHVYVGRWLAFMTALGGILVIAWLGLWLGTGLSSLKLTAFEALQPFVSLFALMGWFGAFALLLSMILPSRRMAASLGGLIVLASFFVNILSTISAELRGLAAWSPLKDYQGGKAINGLDMSQFLSLCVVSIVFAAIGLWLFQRRDIRIAGEGGWRLPRLSLHLLLPLKQFVQRFQR
jgi:ABC-2 type transport system permease protein